MRTRLVVAVVASGLLAGWFLGIVAVRHWNPSTLIAAGEDDTRVTGYIAERLGPDFIPQEAWGHDGKFVFVQAGDPLLTSPERAHRLLDTPVYRAQRVLVPALVGIGGLAGPWGAVWAVPVLMVAAVGVGAWATAGLAVAGGRSVWWGIGFLANPGLFYAYRRGTVDVAAVGLLVLGVYLVTRRRHQAAGLALAAAVLAKELMLVAALGMAIYRRHDRQAALAVAGWPLLAGLGWGLYVRLRLGEPVWDLGTEAAALPLQGPLQVLARWPAVGSVVALAVLAVLIGAVLLAWRAPSVASAAVVGPALLLLVVPETVWGGYVDAWRAAAPVIAVLPAVVWAAWARPMPGADREARLAPA